MIERSSRCGKLGKRLKLTMIRINTFVVLGEVLLFSFSFFFLIYFEVSLQVVIFSRKFLDLFAVNFVEIFSLVQK